VLIDDGTPNSVVLAEQAIEEFLVTEMDAEGRIGALDDLDHEVLLISRNKHGPSLSFTIVVLECVAAYRRALRGAE
jgi:hypothetical protein